MPPAYTPSQKSAIASFAELTQASNSVAARILKQHAWNVERSVDAFFQGSTGSNSTSSAIASALNKQFDSIRDAPAENPDGIGVEGSMEYLGALGVALDEVVVLAIFELLQSPVMGEFTREGFVNGWRSVGADSISKQKAHVTHLRETTMVQDSAYFKKVYKHTFLIARTPGQKAVPLEVATEYWRLLFSSSTACVWRTPNTPWLDWWLEYLEARWNKTVNRDMWDMTYAFALKSLDDETMNWWDENGAWPGVLDDFVIFVKEKRGEQTGA
ncbi:defective in Cullin neddylation protein 1 [Xylona heveae TC161]|uniref:Defective in cullin neddylation protein n=1 Tax=Xylona heveae (strain CBS 132557 / TC161) TaxID=1328760 RepID=A0A165K2S4_XYLHT|nr:defective in Cullin neddylation protein 1 [Xylona heveae TC161]KZF26920.1 defective in Cullin neddylation protein 1 [Xylona heveae TC161]